MSEHATFLDRMARRLDELEAPLADLQEGDAADRGIVDAKATHDVAVERLKALRRLGAELTDEQTQSFRMSVDRLAAQIGRLQQRKAA
jgi:hypothetical protein